MNPVGQSQQQRPPIMNGGVRPPLVKNDMRPVPPPISQPGVRPIAAGGKYFIILFYI
jgi:hypothetical protein